MASRIVLSRSISGAINRLALKKQSLCLYSSSSLPPQSDPNPPADLLMQKYEVSPTSNYTIYAGFRDPYLNKSDENAVIKSYIKLLAQVVGSEDEAKRRIHSVSTKKYKFGAILPEKEYLDKLQALPHVGPILPDEYENVDNELHPGEAFTRKIEDSKVNMRRLIPAQKEQEIVKPRRSVPKEPYVDAFLLKIKMKGAHLTNRQIWSRGSTILPEFVGSSVRIHTGKTFVRCKLTEDKVGHKFGEFANTRKRKSNNAGDAKKKAAKPVKKK
jgi:small subunit ribosomal protein S19